LNQPKKARIAAFLKEFKKIVTAGRGLDIILRHANVACLAELGLTRKNQREEILALTVSDYCEGPEPEKDRPGEIWVFGKRIGGKEVYIKLKIALLSFHPAKHPLCFPFAQKERGDKK